MDVRKSQAEGRQERPGDGKRVGELWEQRGEKVVWGRRGMEMEQQAGRSSPPGTPDSGEGCPGCSEHGQPLGLRLLAKLGLCLSLQPGAGGFMRVTHRK